MPELRTVALEETRKCDVILNTSAAYSLDFASLPDPPRPRNACLRPGFAVFSNRFPSLLALILAAAWPWGADGAQTKTLLEGTMTLGTTVTGVNPEYGWDTTGYIGWPVGDGAIRRQR